MKRLALVILCMLPLCVQAQERDFTLSADPQIVQSGLLQHLLPRFALKHGVRVTQVDAGGAVVIGTEGVPAFTGLGTVWHLAAEDRAGPQMFVDWMLSDIGKRTVAGFAPDGYAPFSGEVAVAVMIPEPTFDGDAVKGEALSLLHCGRCHVINERNRMDGMGQTPSFALMRTFDDWQNRYNTFYVLNPHPSFTQVVDITPPFPANLPPAIVPVEITQDELAHILAYVATIEPADLGAPLQHQ